VRLVHLADLHVGARQYQRLTPAGINQREADVAIAFTRAIDKIISLAPDLVLIAGDFFHQVRPANPAILHAFAQMARLVRSLPDAIVVIVAGNHDTPRSRDTVCILRLFTQLGIHVVDGEPRQLRFEDRSLSLLCVPDSPRLEVELAPDPTSRLNVLVAHGEVRGLLPDAGGYERAALVLEPEDVARPEWDYIALGHWHVYRQMAPKAWYAGALDYVSTNPWGELKEQRTAKLPGKGMIEFDLETGKQRFHHLPTPRTYVDLPAIDGLSLGATELDARIASAIEECKGGIDEKVVRLVVRNVARHVARDFDHRLLREYRRRALHFHLDVRPPEALRTSASGAPGRSATLADTLRERLRDRPLDKELDREQFITLGMEYLAAVESGTGPPVERAEGG
jgi:DNA repair protein SbcD/Mre11